MWICNQMAKTACTMYLNEPVNKDGTHFLIDICLPSHIVSWHTALHLDLRCSAFCQYQSRTNESEQSSYQALRTLITLKALNHQEICQTYHLNWPRFCGRRCKCPQHSPQQQAGCQCHADQCWRLAPLPPASQHQFHHMLPAHINVEKTAMKLLLLEFWFTGCAQDILP